MLLEITGSTKKVRKLVEIAAWNYAERLMGKRLMKTLYIKIDLHRKLLKNDGIEGSCIWDEWEDLRKTPRDFHIELDSTINLREILINLAHEMVHVKQDYRKDNSPIEDKEKEAYEQQEILFERWKNDN